MVYYFDSYGWLTDQPLQGRETALEPPPYGDRTVGQPYPNWTGVEWVLTTYSDPPPPEPDPEPENAWWIYVGPFFDRFGNQKIPILASTDAVVQAIIKDAQVRKYIDLKRADVAQSLDLLISKGLPINKTAILTTSVPLDERYVK